MSRQRILSPEPVDETEQHHSRALRPTDLDAYVGPVKLVEKLQIALSAVKARGEPMEHVLLHGPPGLGKTTLAHIIAQEMGTQMVVTSGPALARPTDLVGTLTRLQSGDVLFIDEIHRLSAVVEEYIYPAMEDFKIDVTVDSGMHARNFTMPLKPFCLIGATTRAGLLTAPMRSRFGITHTFEYYNVEELLTVLHRSATILNIPSADDTASGASLRTIAQRSRGTPRIANRLLRRVRDFAQVRADGRLTPEIIDDALDLEGVDALGLDDLDRKYLSTLIEIYEGGPVGLEAIAATLGEDAGTLEDVVEPYLLQIGFLARTRHGRKLTAQGAAHFNITPRSTPEVSERLFDEASESAD